MTFIERYKYLMEYQIQAQEGQCKVFHSTFSSLFFTIILQIKHFETQAKELLIDSYMILLIIINHINSTNKIQGIDNTAIYNIKKLRTKFEAVLPKAQSMNINPNINPPLSQKQLQICKYAQQFVSSNNRQSQEALKKSKWQDIYTIITHPNIDNKIRIVCCSALKWLIYHKNFVDDPMNLFKCLCQFYAQNLDPNQSPTAGVTKAQQLTQMIIKQIPTKFLNQTNKQLLIEQFLKSLHTNIDKSPRILKILSIIAQQIQVQRINNQKFVGQLLLFLQKIIKLQSSAQNLSLKLLIVKETINLIQVILDLAGNQDQIQSNYVEQFLTHSNLAKTILYKIISEGSHGKQIITNNSQVNQVKFIALELYSSIWVYSLDEPLFYLSLSSLLTSPTQVADNEANIIQKVVVMLQRSIGNEAYYNHFHKNHQRIAITLLSFLKPKQSYLQKIQTEPEYFVDILEDFCMQQQEQLFQTRVGSFLAALCLYIDGFMSFVGSLCIAMIKKFSGSINMLPGVDQYINTINQLWVCSDQEKVSTCVLVLCAISDQLQKREDLSAPLRHQLNFMNPMFKFPDCKLPPFIICRFMFLYAFNAYPTCLDVFLPYKNTKPVYQAQLQACYRIMKRYYNRYKECKQYIEQIGHIVIVSDHLTPLLQNSIMTGQMSSKLQFQILQNLVIWMQTEIMKLNRIKCNKYANLISILIERMVVEDQHVTEDAVFGYLQPFFKLATGKQGSDSQQFILQICVAFVKKFTSLQKSPQRLLILLQMGFRIVQRNNGVLNTCLDLFYQLTKYLPKQLVQSLIQIYLGCLQSQDRQQDNWQCLYGLQNCMIRICQLKAAIPTISVPNILAKAKNYRNDILILKTYMLIYSIILADPQNKQNPQQYIQGNRLPQTIPPYENKPYCVYLLNIAQYLHMTIQYSKWYLHLVLNLMRNQKDINNVIKKYDQDIYCGKQSPNQTVINAYTCSRKLLHPFILKNLDIYNQFRKFWWKFPNRQKIMYLLDKPTLDYITELCTQTTINHKVRKIYKVKPQQIPQTNKTQNNQMQDVQKVNNNYSQMI